MAEAASRAGIQRPEGPLNESSAGKVFASFLDSEDGPEGTDPPNAQIEGESVADVEIPLDDPEERDVTDIGEIERELGPDKEPVEEVAKEEVESPPIETLDDLIRSFEMSPDDFLSHIKVPTEDGRQVPLKSIIDNFRNAPRVNEAARKAVEDFEAAKQERAQAMEARRNGIERLDSLVSVLSAQLQHDESGTELERLKEEDPAQYYLKKDEIRERERIIERAKAEVEEQQKKSAQENQQVWQQVYQREANALITAKPEWKDDARWTEARSDISDLLKSRGFTDEQIGGMVDHRLIISFWEAAQFRKLQKGQIIRQKSARPPPRAVSPASVRAPVMDKQMKRAQALRRAMDKTRGVDREIVAGQIFEEMLK